LNDSSLQDHTYFSINVRTEANVSYSSLFNDLSNLQLAQADYQNFTGPLVAPIGTSFDFEQLNQTTLAQLDKSNSLVDRHNQSHIEYLYETIFYPDAPTPYYTPLSNESYISLTAAIIAPVSRGNISIRSASLSDPPQINTNYYSAETDQALAIYAFKNLRKILAQYATYGWTIGADDGEVSPGPSVQSDAQILEYIRDTAITVWHASSTCAMLPRQSGGVVDARLRVYGVQGLRIVDASIFPVVPDQHIQAATYMVAEKAAQMIGEEC
jgi:choline dehydrogenase